MGEGKKMLQPKKIKIVKEIKSSGMYEAKVDGSEDAVKVPPFPDIEVGQVYEIVGGKYKRVGGEKKTKTQIDPKDKKIKDLEARLKKLEKIAGEKGSEVKVQISDDGATGDGGE